MEIEQHNAEKPMGKVIGKKSKSSWIQWKWKYNLSESVGHNKPVLKGNFIAISAYIKKTETCQINNLMVHLN
jgi:hypothetical protein